MWKDLDLILIDKRKRNHKERKREGRHMQGQSGISRGPLPHFTDGKLDIRAFRRLIEFPVNCPLVGSPPTSLLDHQVTTSINV